MRYRLIVTLVYLFILLLLCTANLTVKAAAPVHISVSLPPIDSVDPAGLPRYPSPAHYILDNLFVGLTRYDAASGQVQNVLAKSWTVSDDQLTWTFTLRNDIQWVRIKWNEEKSLNVDEAVRPVIADDFVFAIQRACDPVPPNPASHTIYIIRGCRRVATTNPDFVDELFMVRTLGIQALSETALEIKLEFPMPQLPALLTLPEFRPVPREAVEKGTDWTHSENIITNGPFTLWMDTKVSETSQTMSLVRNTLWPDPVTGNVEVVDIEFSSSYDKAPGHSLGNNDALYIFLNPASVTGLDEMGLDDLVHTKPGSSITVLGFSTERNVVSKDHFRRALSQALDRDALITEMLTDSALPMSRFMPPGYIGGTNAQPDNRGFLAESAQEALTSTFARCRLPERLVFAVEETQVPLAQWMMNQWKTVLGCPPALFSIQQMSAEQIQSIAHGAIDTASNYAKPRPHLWLFTWTPDYPDANAVLSDALHCRYGYIRTGFPCTDADSLLDSAFMETDPEKRTELYDKAETSWFGETGTFPVVPLYVSINAAGWSTQIKGATVDAPLQFDTWILETSSP